MKFNLRTFLGIDHKKEIEEVIENTMEINRLFVVKANDLKGYDETLFSLAAEIVNLSNEISEAAKNRKSVWVLKKLYKRLAQLNKEFSFQKNNENAN